MRRWMYRKFRPDVARNSHMIFFELQRQDGQLPAEPQVSAAGFGQIQMVVPIAATAWELAQSTGDDELLRAAYAACSRWDDWLIRYRNTRGTGLIEGFCTYDTGNDNSPRWDGVPDQCPDGMRRRCPRLRGFHGFVLISRPRSLVGEALAAMAKALGKTTEADAGQRVQKIRRLILARSIQERRPRFFDLDAQDRFVTIRCDILTRVCGEHVPDQALFDEFVDRQIHEPKAFWAA